MAHIPNRMGSSTVLRVRIPRAERQDHPSLQHLLLHTRPLPTVRQAILPTRQRNSSHRNHITSLSYNDNPQTFPNPLSPDRASN